MAEKNSSPATNQLQSYGGLTTMMKLMTDCLFKGEEKGAESGINQLVSNLPGQAVIQQVISSILNPQDPDVTYPPHIDAPIVPAPPPAPSPPAVPSAVSTEDVNVQLQDIPVASKNILAQKVIPIHYSDDFRAQFGQSMLSLVENVSMWSKIFIWSK
jgi:hypothetical protein